MKNNLLTLLLFTLIAAANAAAQTVAAVPVYRLYGSQDCIVSCGYYVDAFSQHFYTKDIAERDKISVMGRQPVYLKEGTEYYILPSQVAGTVPFYKFTRTYKPDGSGNTNDLYPNQQRKQFFQTGETKPQGHYTRAAQPFGYVFAAKTAETVPLYRLYKPLKTTKMTNDEDHFYTTSEEGKNKAIQAGYIDEGIAAYVWKSAVQYGADGKPVGVKATKDDIERAFQTVYGYSAPSNRFAFWSAQTADYARIVAEETKRLNAEPLARKLLIAKVYKDTFGRVANKAEMDYWLPKAEYYKQIFDANRAFLYAPNGAKDLVETVKRALTTNNGKTPNDGEIKTALEKYRKTKAIYDEM